MTRYISHAEHAAREELTAEFERLKNAERVNRQWRRQNEVFERQITVGRLPRDSEVAAAIEEFTPNFVSVTSTLEQQQ